MEDPIFESYLRFAALCARPDDAMDLIEASLLVAEIARPGLDHRRYHRQIAMLADAVHAQLGPSARRLERGRQLEDRAFAAHVLDVLADVLARREGFHGNSDAYYDPANAYVNMVIETRTGLPIGLGIVYLAVAEQLGIPLRGVGLPAHFVTKWPLPPAQGGDLFLDAFHGGRLLTAGDCRQLVREVAGMAAARACLDPRWAAPLSHRAVIARLLQNLKRIYLQRGETALALEVVDRLVLLRPDLPEELRDRGLLRLAMGEPLLAAADIATYATRAPGAPDVQRLRRRVGAAAAVRATLN